MNRAVCLFCSIDLPMANATHHEHPASGTVICEHVRLRRHRMDALVQHWPWLALTFAVGCVVGGAVIGGLAALSVEAVAAEATGIAEP